MTLATRISQRFARLLVQRKVTSSLQHTDGEVLCYAAIVVLYAAIGVCIIKVVKNSREAHFIKPLGVGVDELGYHPSTTL